MLTSSIAGDMTITVGIDAFILCVCRALDRGRSGHKLLPGVFTNVKDMDREQ